MTSQPSPLIENIDYIINDAGNLVFTSHYLLKRGYCCMSGCLNCPYEYSKKVDPNVPAELSDFWDEFVPELDEESEDEND